MPYEMKPLACDPARIKGMSERLIVSHYENNYGGEGQEVHAQRNRLPGTGTTVSVERRRLSCPILSPRLRVPS